VIRDDYPATVSLNEALTFELAEDPRDRLTAEPQLARELRLGQTNCGGPLLLGFPQQ